MSTLLGLRTALYPAPDLARAKAWYTQVLEQAPYFDEPFYVGFEVGGFELGLLPDATPGSTGPQPLWGVANADAESWAAFFAPAKVPQPILDRLAKEIVTALESPAVAEKIRALGFALRIRSPREFVPYLKMEIDTWAEIIKAAGLKAE